MADEKTTTANPAKKRTINVRSNASLIAKGDRGKVLVAARGAMSVGKDHKFEGTKLTGTKSGYAILNRIGKSGGALWDADNEVFGPALTAAKAANTDISARKYTGSVRDFIDKFYALAPKGKGGGGVRRTPKLW